MLPTSLSFLLRCTIPHHSPWKPQSDKSRVRAESGEPKAPLFVETFPFAHGFLTGDNDGIGIVHDAVADGICQDRVNQFVTPAGNIELRTQDRGSTLVTGFHHLTYHMDHR